MSQPLPRSTVTPLTVGIEPVYQPVVALDSRAIMGYEALTRPCTDSPWTSPIQLLEAAHVMNATVAFDWRCRLAALRGALDAHMPPDMVLFVNAEPVALDAPPPADSAGLLAAAGALSITVEITERHLMRNPAGLLRAVEHARHLGWRVAIDDVGADSSSLALLPLIRPDVIKLDMRMVQGRSTSETAVIVSAIAAESDRTGARVLAEGIETEDHERTALDMGATVGQGWLYGTPGPLPNFMQTPTPHRPAHPEPAVTVRVPTAVTPYGVVSALGAPRRSGRSLYDEMEMGLLRTAAAMGPSAIVIATRGPDHGARHSFDAILDELAGRTALTAVFEPCPAREAARYRAVTVDASDPLALERSIIVVAPFQTAALVGLDRGTSDDGRHLYNYRLTYDRNVVLDAATVLLHRLSV